MYITIYNLCCVVFLIPTLNWTNIFRYVWETSVHDYTIFRKRVVIEIPIIYFISNEYFSNKYDKDYNIKAGFRRMNNASNNSEQSVMQIMGVCVKSAFPLTCTNKAVALRVLCCTWVWDWLTQLTARSQIIQHRLWVSVLHQPLYLRCLVQGHPTCQLTTDRLAHCSITYKPLFGT